MKTEKVALLAMVVALYVGISLLLAPFSFANIQVRIAESLTLLPVLMPESIIALALACLLTNLIGVMSGVNILGFLDVLVGTAATLLAAYLTHRLRNYRFKGYPVLATLPPIFINALFIGLELQWVLNPGSGFNRNLFIVLFFEIAVGQFIAVFIIGLPLIKKLSTLKIFNEENTEE